MKLLKCYINGFGCLIDKEITFDKMHIEISQNGNGKTTLAHFIKSMFYGLVKDKNKVDERELYKPFDSNNFGGSIEFEYKNSNYKIERSFAKKAKDDILKVYKENKEIEINDNPGITFFGLDVESFTRTIFINAEDLSISSTEDMRSKISGFISKTDVQFDMKAVESKIQKRMKEIKSRKKGLYFDCINKIEELKSKIKNLNNIDESLKDKYVKFSSLKSKLETKRKQMSDASTINIKLEKWKSKESKEEAINDKKKSLEAIKEKYNDLLQNKDIVENIKKKNKEKNDLEIVLNNCKLDYNEQFDLKTFENKNLVNLDVKTINEYKEKLSKLRDLESINYDVAPKDREIYDKYKNANIDFESLENEVSQLDKIINASNTSEIKEEQKTRSFSIWQIVGIVIIILGIVLGIIKSPLFSISLVGFLVLIVPLLHTKPKTQDVNQNKDNDSIASLKNSINFKTAPFGYSLDRFSYDSAYHLLKKEYDTFKEIKENIETNEKTKEQNELVKKEIENSLTNFFETYSYYGKYEDNFEEMSKNKGYYEKLKVKVENNEKKKKELVETITKIDKTIDDFKRKYSVINVSTFISEFEKENLAYEIHLSGLKNLEQELNSYILENELFEKPLEQEVDIEKLESEIEKLQSEVGDLEKEINNDEQELSELDDLNNEVIEQEDLKNKYDNEYVILQHTLNSLEKAKDNLNQKYINPMADKFKHYAKMLDFEYGQKPILDNNFDFMYEDKGINRDYMHLSQGQLTMATLCYRLALIDNLFNDPQFIIIDDAFINLDEKNLDYTLNLVKKLSNLHQIIYFACHNSRGIN